MAPAEEACHNGYAGRVAWLPGQRLAHCRQRQGVVDVRIAERIIGRHADVPGVMLLCPHSLQPQKRNILTNEKADHLCCCAQLTS